MGLQLGQVSRQGWEMFSGLLNFRYRRQPESLIKPGSANQEVQNKVSKASRYLILVRHGQYEINARESHNQVLTELGRFLQLLLIIKLWRASAIQAPL